MYKLIFFALIGLSAGQLCPPPEVLHPCTCIYLEGVDPGVLIACEDIRESFNLQEIFANASDFVNDDVIFTGLIISNTSLSTIEEGATSHLKFEQISIRENPNLTYISPRALMSSWNATTQLSMLGNPIENEGEYERDIFDFINGFKKLEILSMQGSRVTSIPENAFQNLMTSLHYVNLEDNRISSIGSRAFAGLPLVSNLWLENNFISPESIIEETFSDISASAMVHLVCNMIDCMEQRLFQHLLDTGAMVTVGDAFYSCPNSKFRRLHCDERANWICDNEERYHIKLHGFQCKVEFGTPGEDIWEYCDRRNSTIIAK